VTDLTIIFLPMRVRNVLKVLVARLNTEFSGTIRIHNHAGADSQVMRVVVGIFIFILFLLNN
jgi:hypothetical protein